jgi:hypothetical protein
MAHTPLRLINDGHVGIAIEVPDDDLAIPPERQGWHREPHRFIFVLEKVVAALGEAGGHGEDAECAP